MALHILHRLGNQMGNGVMINGRRLLTTRGAGHAQMSSLLLGTAKLQLPLCIYKPYEIFPRIVSFLFGMVGTTGYERDCLFGCL
jgi:hypothetical protein